MIKVGNIFYHLCLSACSLALLGGCTSAKDADTISQRVENLLEQMTLDEKIAQMNQVNYLGNEDNARASVRAGAGSVLNPITFGFVPVPDIKAVNDLQRIAVEETRLGIPIITGRDVIHGFKTAMPIPLGQAASFNPELVRSCARVAAIEARASGVHVTFAPMLDISRDARWGRIAESFGEDPYLTSLMGAAMIKGFQTDNLKDPTAIGATAKHFIGYGASEAGRDYNSTSVTPLTMRNVYMPPFKAAVEAGAVSVMTSFNDNDGIPMTANKHLLRDVLRDEWGFDGFVVTDWNSSGELLAHGFAKDSADVARLAVNAGVDMEMNSGTFVKNLKRMVAEGKVSEATIDDAVRRILRVKFEMGLFENPYFDESAAEKVYLCPQHLATAKQAAIESAVLLKNENNTLPLGKEVKRIAIIGPLADQPHEQLGTWIWDANRKATVTPLKAFNDDKRYEILFESGLNYSRDRDISRFNRVKETVAKADMAIVFVGEEAQLSGEAHSLANLDLVGAQSRLLAEVKSVGRPVVMVVMAGRPLTIGKNLKDADAVLYCFHPGTMGGPAIHDLLTGEANPSGKLPVTFVSEVGQIPLYYNHNNTGRPSEPITKSMLYDIPQFDLQNSAGFLSIYLDAPTEPLYPFGYGLSYSRFEYADLKLSTSSYKMDDRITASVTLKNTSDVEGTEVVQLYIRDKVGSIVRPVKELKGFQRITLKGGESKKVTFTLETDDLAFFGIDNIRKAEAGDFDLWIGPNSQEGLKASFTLNE